MPVRNNPRTVTLRRDRRLGHAKIWSREDLAARANRIAAENAKAGHRGRLLVTWWRRLLSVLLDARGAQTGQAVLVDRILPGQEFLDRERITAARLFERKQSAAHGCNDLRLAANDPTLGSRRGQIRDRQGGTVRPDDILDPRAMRFGHSNSHVLDNTGCDTKHGSLKFT